MTVDELAQEIRRVDGDSEHRLGAGALAEALMPFLSRPSAIVEEPMAVASMVEQAFRDGLAYGTNVRLSRPEEHDIAWLQSRARAALNAALTVEPEAPTPKPQIDDPWAILERLAGGDSIAFSRDGDNAWFREGDKAWVGNGLIELRQKGYLRRTTFDDEMWETDVISAAGREAHTARLRSAIAP